MFVLQFSLTAPCFDGAKHGCLVMDVFGINISIRACQHLNNNIQMAHAGI
jgi:hypothetical protein